MRSPSSSTPITTPRTSSGSSGSTATQSTGSPQGSSLNRKTGDIDPRGCPHRVQGQPKMTMTEFAEKKSMARTTVSNTVKAAGEKSIMCLERPLLTQRRQDRADLDGEKHE
ncbi:Uncharacterized protein FKW44_024833, partial [Caligus rogercresseyi]